MVQRILLLLALVAASYQYEPCLATAKNQRLNDGYSFALAKVPDANISPQEACYYSCGAQLVTYSKNMGDMKQLTSVDKAMPYLGLVGFLRPEQSYFVNHLGVTEQEGGNGIGCIHVQSEKKIKRYAKSHPLCSQAKNAICGFWGQQVIPEAPIEPPGLPQPSVSEPKPSISKAAPPVSKTGLSTARPQPSAPVSLPQENQFEMEGKRYSVLKQGQESLSRARDACAQSQYKLGAIGTINMFAVTNELRQNAINKAIVGSWNGDDYSLQGSSCLILDVQFGIFPGQCSDAETVLCQHF
ncbi:hypothetical protein BY458DRAFT_520843 [Sporodiniella umbellata]|nr:hypothetical protein BY458DRAFT_520843 [Sporodiniella umbellata]